MSTTRLHVGSILGTATVLFSEECVSFSRGYNNGARCHGAFEQLIQRGEMISKMLP